MSLNVLEQRNLNKEKENLKFEDASVSCSLHKNTTI